MKHIGSSFHYLHKKYAALIPEIERVLGEMEWESTILRISNTILKRLSGSS